MNGYANLSEPDAQGRVGVRVRVKVRLMRRVSVRVRVRVRRESLSLRVTKSEGYRGCRHGCRRAH